MSRQDPRSFKDLRVKKIVFPDGTTQDTADETTPISAESLISEEENNALQLGEDNKLFAEGGAGFQFLSGSDSPVGEVTPDDVNAPAQYYNTNNQFTWNWNIGMAAWIPVPKVYRAILNQSGFNAPVPTVFENTLGGTVVWTRSAAGAYTGTLAGAFSITNTFVLL